MELKPILLMIILVGAIATFFLVGVAYVLYKVCERGARKGAARRAPIAGGEAPADDDDRLKPGGWMEPAVIKIVSDRESERDDHGRESAAAQHLSADSKSATAAPPSESLAAPSGAPPADLAERARTDTAPHAAAVEAEAIPSIRIEQGVDAPTPEPAGPTTPQAFDTSIASPGAEWEVRAFAAAFPSPPAARQGTTSTAKAGRIVFWEYTGEGLVPVDPDGNPTPALPSRRPRRSAARDDQSGDWL